MGCGRSGTSLVAGLFNSQKFYRGPKIYHPTHSNPTGYFESPEINRINELILRQNTPNRFDPFSDKIFHIPILGSFLSKLNFNKNIPIHGQRWLSIPSKMINQTLPNDLKIDISDLLSNTPFCFKDPRFSFTLKEWKKYLPQNTKVIVVFRNPLNTIISIKKEIQSAPYLRNRISMTDEDLIELWKSIYENILQEHRTDSFFIHYKQVLDKSGLERLKEFTQEELSINIIKEKYNRSTTGVLSEGNLLQVYQQLCDEAKFTISK